MPPTLPDLPEAFVPSWLSDTVTRPHANVATSTARPQFEILPIDAVELDAVGLLPRSITGLPEDLWGASEPDTLARLFRAQPVTGLPAALSLTEMLALAELVPPVARTRTGASCSSRGSTCCWRAARSTRRWR
jgi:hypothetical protein